MVSAIGRLPDVARQGNPVPRISNPDGSGQWGEIRDIFSELGQVRKTLQGGARISARELLVYQMRASHLNLHIELVSRISEGISSTVKRLQAGQ